MPDLRELVPHVISDLKPGDKVIGVEEFHFLDAPKELPDASKMWLQFCGVDALEKIGEAGPPIASGFIPGHESAKDQGRFRVPFDRDSRYMTDDMRDEYPQLVVVTNRFNNEHLGMLDRVRSGAQYGRDYHEYRDPETDPLARQLTKERGWLWEPQGGFYAQVDCGAMNIRAIHWCCTHLPQGFAYLDETYVGMDGVTRTNFESIRIRMAWILRKISSNAMGFIGYRPGFEGDHENHQMEDSPTSMLDEEGNLANAEQDVYGTYIQADLCGAYLCAAEMYDYVGTREADGSLMLEAASFRLRAARLKEKFFEIFWDDARGYLAAGAHHDERGHIIPLWDKKGIPAFSLSTSIWDNVPRERIEKYAATLMAPDMLAAAGIRTRSTKSRGFNRGKYHGGTVWPFMSAKIADGFMRQGFPHFAHELYRRVVRVVEELKMWPELVPGDPNSNEIRVNEYKIVIWSECLQMEEDIETTAQYAQGWTFTAWWKAKRRLAEPLPPITPVEQQILDSLPR